MINEQGRNPGKPDTFEVRAKVPMDLPALPRDDGGDFEHLASGFSRLASTLGRLADEAQAREERQAIDAASGQALADVQARDASEGAAAPVTRSDAGAGPNRRTGGASNHPLAAKVRAAAEAAGLPAEPVVALVAQESAFDPERRPIANGRRLSSAFGLFQLLSDDQKKYGGGPGSSVDEQIAAGIAKTKANYEVARRALGREPTAGELYVVHYQGVGAGPRILADRGGGFRATLDTIRPGWGDTVIRANPWLSGIQSNADFIAWSENKMRARGAGGSAPAGPPRPLALRTEGGAADRAYNQSLREAEFSRLAVGIREDVQRAETEAGDDPAKFEQALARARDERLKAAGEIGGDPQFRESVTRAYGSAAGAGRAAAMNKAERKADDERKSAAVNNATAMLDDAERAAYRWGANPDGDGDLAESAGRADRAIGAMLARGELSPGQASQMREGLATRVATARVRGTYDALPDPEAKGRFLDGLEARWAANDPALAGLSAAELRRATTEMRANWREASARTRHEQDGRRQALSRHLRDDVASIAATGKGLAIDGRELDPADVARVVGAEQAAAWQQQRADARELRAASVDFPRLTEAELAARLDAAAPVPGSDGFAARERQHGQLLQMAQQLIRARRADPAAAVMAFDEVAQAKKALDPKRPDTFAALARARLDAQERLGIDELARAPLTEAEADALLKPVKLAAPGQDGAAMETLIADIQRRYGALARPVVVQLLHRSGVGKDLAGKGYGLLDQMMRGEAPARADLRAAGALRQADQADRAVAPPPGGRAEVRRMPLAAQIEALRRHPDKAAEFDARFGRGAAAIYLNNGTVTRDAGGENYQP